ncbi:glycosyl hydrolase family 1, partial [Escherichia coli]|nr:glycosyl hydrolase family 1 [Escherichia coli]
GYRNSWQGKIASYENKPDNNNELKKIVEYCKRKKIKTVFWNKEDPFHFERFSDSASFFDIIYTTDADSINRYDSLLD